MTAKITKTMPLTLKPLKNAQLFVNKKQMNVLVELSKNQTKRLRPKNLTLVNSKTPKSYALSLGNLTKGVVEKSFRSTKLNDGLGIRFRGVPDLASISADEQIHTKMAAVEQLFHFLNIEDKKLRET